MDSAVVGRTRHLETVRRSNPLLPLSEANRLAATAQSDDAGLGPVGALLADPTVSEVMINGPGPVWLERHGVLAVSPLSVSTEQIELLIERIVAPLGLRADRSAPIVDARLSDGSRVSIVLPPLALAGPTVTIRRFGRSGRTLADFASGTAARELERLASERARILVVGPTSSGKTSLLNALIEASAASAETPERIVSIEDTAELQLEASNLARLEARPANTEGVGEVTLRELVRAALRMRPDRLIVGEVRGAEALDLLLALSSGHAGSMATCHASAPLAGLRRLETLAALGAGNVAPNVLRQLVYQSLDAVVLVERIGAARHVSKICAVPDEPAPGADGPLSTLWAKR